MLRHFALALFSVLLLCACSSKIKEIRPPEWTHEKDAIHLRFTGDQNLNRYRNRAHSMMICLYQLQDPGSFKERTEDRGGLASLLECSRFDPSVTYARRLIVQPNQALEESLDRTAGAQYLGIVAGYYGLDKNRSVRTIAIPVTGEKKKRVLIQKPEKMSLELHFGPEGILTPEPQTEVKP